MLWAHCSPTTPDLRLEHPFEIHELVLACRDQNWTPPDEAQGLELLEFRRDWNDGHETLCSITLDDGGGFITASQLSSGGKTLATFCRVSKHTCTTYSV